MKEIFFYFKNLLQWLRRTTGRFTRVVRNYTSPADLPLSLTLYQFVGWLCAAVGHLSSVIIIIIIIISLAVIVTVALVVVAASSFCFSFRSIWNLRRSINLL